MFGCTFCEHEEKYFTNLMRHFGKAHLREKLLQEGDKRRDCKWCYDVYDESAANLVRHVCDKHEGEVIDLLQEPWRNYDFEELKEKLEKPEMTAVNPRIGEPKDFIKQAEACLGTAKDLLEVEKSINNFSIAANSRLAIEHLLKAVLKMDNQKMEENHIHDLDDLILNISDRKQYMRDELQSICGLEKLKPIQDYVGINYRGLSYQRKGQLSSEFFLNVNVREIVEIVDDLMIKVKNWNDAEKEKLKKKNKKKQKKKFFS